MPGEAARALAATASIAHIPCLSGDRAAAVSFTLNEESPGSTEQRCRVTPGRRVRLPRESATESIPPAFGRVRSKGCGKSAPRGRQRARHGKPHRVQDRIGAAHEPVPARRPGWSLEAEGNLRPRGMVAAPSGVQNPAYRSPGNFVESENGQADAIRRLGLSPLAPLRREEPRGDASAPMRPGGLQPGGRPARAESAE